MSDLIKKETIKIVETIDFEKLRNKKILITGASGLIGVFLISTLNQVKHKYNIDVYAWVKGNIDPIFTDIFNYCTIIKGDITNLNNILIDTLKFDCIIHAAGYGQPSKFMDDKTKTIQLNTTTTIDLLNRLTSGGSFLFVSTSELYSGLDYENITENQIGLTNTNHPRSCYIEGKRCGEAICYSYLNKGYDIKIVRLSLAYGPGTKKGDNRVMNSLIQKGLDNNEIKLMDSGEAIRTYCYITDVIEMFWNVLLFGKEPLYNIGGKSRVSILELANLIGSELNKPVITPIISNELVLINIYQNLIKQHSFH